jgi:hypothetical protein
MAFQFEPLKSFVMKTLARYLFLIAITLVTLPGIQAFAHEPNHHGPTWAEENNSRMMRMREYEARRDFGWRRLPLSGSPSGPNVPLDGGITLLLMAGLGFGIWKMTAGKAKANTSLSGL